MTRGACGPEDVGRTRYERAVTLEAARLAAERRAQLQDAASAGLSDADLIMVVQAELEHAVLVTSDAAIKSMADVTAKDWDAVTFDR